MTFPIWRDFMKCLCYIASVLREADCCYKSLLETGSAMWPPPVSPARQLHWRCLWLQSPCATAVGRWLGDSTVWLSSVWPGTASWGTPSSPPATRPTWRRGGDALSEEPRLSTKVCGVSLWRQQYCSMVGEATHLGRRDGVSDRVRRIQWDHSHTVPAAGSTQTSHRSLRGQPGHPQQRGPDLSSNNRPRHFRGATPTSETSLSTLPSKHSTSLKHSQQLLLPTSLLTLLAGSALLSYWILLLIIK